MKGTVLHDSISVTCLDDAWTCVDVWTMDEAGNDHLVGSRTHDNLDGGPGNDTIVRDKHLWRDNDPDWVQAFWSHENEIDNDWHRQTLRPGRTFHA